MGNTDSFWQMSEGLATVELGPLRMMLDARNPSRGICDVALSGETLVGTRLLGITLRPAIVQPADSFGDAYTRGCDLVVTYTQARLRGVQSQFCWRAVQPMPDVVGVELILAMQTSLLRGSTSIQTQTYLRSADVWTTDGLDNWRKVTESASFPATELRGCVYLFRPLAGEMSYAEMVFPGDDGGAATMLDGETAQLEHSLVTEPLEKGVIRKVRLQGVFLPRHGDLERAGQVFEAFAAAAPPLTT